MMVYQHLILVGIFSVTVWNSKVSADYGIYMPPGPKGDIYMPPGPEAIYMPPGSERNPGPENKSEKQNYWECLKCLKTSFPGTGLGGCVKKLNPGNKKVFADCCEQSIGSDSSESKIKLDFCSNAQKGLVSALSVCYKKNDFLQLGTCLEERILSESHSQEEKMNLLEFMECKNKAAACLTPVQNDMDKPWTAAWPEGRDFPNYYQSGFYNNYGGKLDRSRKDVGNSMNYRNQPEDYQKKRIKRNPYYPYYYSHYHPYYASYYPYSPYHYPYYYK